MHTLASLSAQPTLPTLLLTVLNQSAAFRLRYVAARSLRAGQLAGAACCGSWSKMRTATTGGHCSIYLTITITS